MKLNKRVTAAVAATSIAAMGGAGLFAGTASAQALPAQSAPALESSTIGTPTVLSSDAQPEFWHALVHGITRIVSVVKVSEEAFRVTAQVARVSSRVTHVFNGSGRYPTAAPHGYLPQDAQFDTAN